MHNICKHILLKLLIIENSDRANPARSAQYYANKKEAPGKPGAFLLHHREINANFVSSAVSLFVEDRLQNSGRVIGSTGIFTQELPQRLNQSGVGRTPVYQTHCCMKSNQTVPIFLGHLGHLDSYNILPFWFYRVFLLLMVLLYHKGLDLSTLYIGVFIIYPNIIISAAKSIASRKWFFIIAVTYWIVRQMARTIMIKVVMLVPPAVERDYTLSTSIISMSKFSQQAPRSISCRRSFSLS